MSAGRIWIGRIECSPAVKQKIHSKHDLTLDDVNDAGLAGAASSLRWDDDPIYGRRLMARGSTSDGREILCFLYALDEPDGTWELFTAYA